MTISGPAQILVVEDELDVSELIVEVLERAGYCATSAAEGYRALDLLAERRFDLMITDLRMPGMNGVELVERSRVLSPDVDVMVLTAHATLDSAIRTLKMGAHDYVTKPFDVHDLTEKVGFCLNKRYERLAAQHTPPEQLVALHRAIAHSSDPDSACHDIVRLMDQWFVANDMLFMFFAPWGDQEPCVSLLRTLTYISGRVETLTPEARSVLEARLADSPDPWLFDDLSSAMPSSSPWHALTVLLESGGEHLGALRLLRSPDMGPYAASEAQSLYIFGAQLALAVLQARTHRELVAAFSNLSEVTTAAAKTLVEALGAFDECTRRHSQRVGEYARQFALRLGLGPQEVQGVAIAGLLHDIGKLGVGGAALRKNGCLTEEERERFLLHPVQGAQILSGMESLSEVVPLVRHHHERYDGTGYPDGLAGEKIPLGARLLAVVDAYDSMTSDRPYRAGLGQGEATRRLQSGAGTQWDAHLVEVWLDCLADVGQRSSVALRMEV